MTCLMDGDLPWKLFTIYNLERVLKKRKTSMNFFAVEKIYRRRRQSATAATVPPIYGNFYMTNLNIKPKKIIKY